MLKEIKKDEVISRKEEIKKRKEHIDDLFINRALHFKSLYENVKFSISKDSAEISIFIIGNKKAGTKYDMETWKDVPIYKNSISYKNSEINPFDIEYYLGMRVNFSGSSGSEDWKLGEEDLIKKFDLAIKNAINDFIETKENTI